jgi:hypothetical protein
MSPQGQKYHRAREAAEEAGVEFTAHVPPLDSPEARTCWDAFSLLSRTRGNNETGPQPIVLRELTCYLDEESITDADHRQDVIFFIKSLDDRYLELVAEKAKAERDKNTKKGKRGGRRR